MYSSTYSPWYIANGQLYADANNVPTANLHLQRRHLHAKYHKWCRRLRHLHKHLGYMEWMQDRSRPLPTRNSMTSPLAATALPRYPA